MKLFILIALLAVVASAQGISGKWTWTQKPNRASYQFVLDLDAGILSMSAGSPKLSGMTSTREISHVALGSDTVTFDVRVPIPEGWHVTSYTGKLDADSGLLTLHIQYPDGSTATVEARKE